MITPFGTFVIAACLEIMFAIVVKRACKREQESVRAHMGEARHFDDFLGGLRFFRFVWTSAPSVVPQARRAIYGLRIADLLFLAAMIWVGVDMFAHPPPSRGSGRPAASAP